MSTTVQESTSNTVEVIQAVTKEEQAVHEMFICIACGFIILMQLGFAFLENGSVRAKNSTNILIKNMFDLCVSGFIYWIVGFGIAFG